MALDAAAVVATVLYPQIKKDLCEMKTQGYFLCIERQDFSVTGHPSSL